MIRRSVAIALLYAAGLYAQSSPGQATPDSWRSLRFLLGTWEAKTQGGSAGATSSGTYAFQLELRNHVLARHSTIAGCKGAADYDCEHSDLLYVFEDAANTPLKAIYFDNEGHTIHYEVSTPAPNQAVFISSATQPGPQFRLIYERTGSTMSGKFQMRMPGQSDFKSYLEWSGAKK